MRRSLSHITALLLLTAFAYAGPSIVHVIKVEGAINPATADYIHDALEHASAAGAECLVIQLNTPGGLLNSTRDIVTDFLTAPLPVVVYVSPAGAQAASAGVFVTMAAHIAVMAPGTNIGAAHPVTMGEQQDSIMMTKATNDAAAFIRTISEKRNRNVSWAEDAVRKSVSLTETEALEKNVIDTVASSIRELLERIDGRKVETAAGVRILATRNATIEMFEISFRQKILEILTDPNIAYIFMMLGIYGLLFELYNPGAILPGIVGFICLVVAFYSLHTLPVNYAGVALIIFAVILFLLEIKIASHGLLAVGGVISLLLGSLMLIQSHSSLEFVSISWEVIVVTVVLTVAFFVFAIGKGLSAQRRKPTTGSQGMVGEVGEVYSDLKPGGQVKVHGELWSAVSLEGTIKKGTRVKVEEIANLTLKVRKSYAKI